MKRVCRYGLGLLLLTGCVSVPVQETNDLPTLFPDYREVTLPPDIAPLTFEVAGKERFRTRFEASGGFAVEAANRRFVSLPESAWRDLLQAAVGGTVTVRIEAQDAETGSWTRYAPFCWKIAPDSIDFGLVYRRIAPGYESWGEMGVYQRELGSYRETPLLENRSAGYGCFNCHAFCGYDPATFQLHVRAVRPGTLIRRKGTFRRVDLKTERGSAAVYPAWHPSGDFIAYSVNDTRQQFYADHPDRLAVYDRSSDLILYDAQHNEIVTDDRLQGTAFLETFPAWSPDGRWLYFCRAAYGDTLPDLRYDICRIAFDAEERVFRGAVETAVGAAETGRSALFPRLSPDGRFLLYTETGAGTFPVWRRDADLRAIDLATGKPLDTNPLNSPDTESYHAWSSNGRWVVFSSRRLDGLYTRLFIAHCDADGVFSKPFLLPQSDPDRNRLLLQSYNIPEFVAGPVPVSARESERLLQSEPEPVRVQTDSERP